MARARLAFLAHPAGLPPLLAFDPHAVSLAEGVRAGFAIAAVVALSGYLHWPALMEAALGAMLTCLCDGGGSPRQRLVTVLWFALVGSLITAGFGVVRDWPIWAAAPLAGAAVFAMGFARIHGQAAMQVGNLLTVVLVLAMRAPNTPREAWAVGLTFLAGSLWAVLLTAVIWRLHPYRPARAAIGDVLRALAVMVGDLRRMREAGQPEEAQWDRHARLHRRAVRDAIERARAVVLETVRVRGQGSNRAALAWMRLETADQLFGLLIGLSDLVRDANDEPAARSLRVLRLLQPILPLLGRAILSESVANRPGLERAIAAVATVARRPGAAADPLDGVAGEIVERLRLLGKLSTTSAVPPDFGAGPSRAWGTWREVVRANWRADSAALRHALRVGLAAGLAIAATMRWPAPYAHWFTITLVLTMQPYFALTFTKAIERVGGTVLGGLLAAVLATVLTTPLAMSFALFPLSVATLAVRGVSFGLFMAMLTPVVVLLSELGQPGSSELHIAAMRATLTLAGGIGALALAWLLWPAWEPARLGAELSSAITAHGAYAATEIEAVLGDADAGAVAQARRAAGVASNALESSLQRALLEPRRGTEARLEAALTIDAALRRMAGRLSSLQANHADAAAHDPVAWRDWAAWIRATTGHGRHSVMVPPTRPPMPRDADADALARIAGQIDVVCGAAARLA